MGRFHHPVFSKKTIYLDFKAQENALYRCHGNVILEENTLAKFRRDMITLTASKDRICLFVWKKEKLFRAFF